MRCPTTREARTSTSMRRRSALDGIRSEYGSNQRSITDVSGAPGVISIATSGVTGFIVTGAGSLPGAPRPFQSPNAWLIIGMIDALTSPTISSVARSGR